MRRNWKVTDFTGLGVATWGTVPGVIAPNTSRPPLAAKKTISWDACNSFAQKDENNKSIADWGTAGKLAYCCFNETVEVVGKKGLKSRYEEGTCVEVK
jgi:hypothetical protein